MNIPATNEITYLIRPTEVTIPARAFDDLRRRPNPQPYRSRCKRKPKPRKSNSR